VMCALPKLLAKRIKIVVPYFPTGTMEHVSNYGEIATAKTLARMLSSIPSCAGGLPQICICDIHSLTNQYFFGDDVLVRSETCIPLLLFQLERIKEQSNFPSEKTISTFSSASPSPLTSPEPITPKHDLCIAFPDDGAQKRFGNLFKDYEQIICIKKRDGDLRHTVIKEGNPKNKHVIIVDDLVQSGGTLATCGYLLKKEGALTVSCYCTHPVFPKDSWKRFTAGGSDENLFAKFYITNTIPERAKLLKKHPPFQVLSIVYTFLPVIGDADEVADMEH